MELVTKDDTNGDNAAVMPHLGQLCFQTLVFLAELDLQRVSGPGRKRTRTRRLALRLVPKLSTVRCKISPNVSYEDLQIASELSVPAALC
jgi:hypothetical protein